MVLVRLTRCSKTSPACSTPDPREGAAISLWTRIREALSTLAAGESVSSALEALRKSPDRSVAFTIAVIALGAKMAKADGRVTRDEVAAFREVFHIAREDEAHAARVFDLARQDVSGFEEYARRVQRMFADDPETLVDLTEGLFHIALADGAYHPGEARYLETIAAIFSLPEGAFESLRARFVPDCAQAGDPYTVLGVSRGMPREEIRKRWREEVMASHPDRLAARGVPPEAVCIAERRLADLNVAWEQISRQEQERAG